MLEISRGVKLSANWWCFKGCRCLEIELVGCEIDEGDCELCMKVDRKWSLRVGEMFVKKIKCII